ncbi:MAG: alpha-mannosidase [Planctomycetota bacterium]
MSEKPAPRIAFIVSHTHWDREWYRTCHRFRVDLARVVRRVLDSLEHDAAFRHFLLDGQAIILEDYLEIHPEDAQRIRALVGAGSLSVGPWYILPDEFLVSAEATVRNLLIGHRLGAAFGEVQKVGYVPDSVGHIAQMPQILRQAGIDSFIYTRGNGDEIVELGLEHIWRAPDGSEVLAIHQCEGYCNAGALGYEELWNAHTRRDVDPQRAVEQIGELFSRMRERSRCDIWLLNNGCDHLPPQPRLGSILEALRAAFPLTEFRHGSLGEYVEAVKRADFEPRVRSGELIRGRDHPILSGVWSARVYLKQQNDIAQTLLSGSVEPLRAYSHFCLGEAYPQRMIERAWKLLLENHPHDSICGCSTDEVHREMETRFAGVIDTAEELLREELVRIAPTFARRPDGDRDVVIAVANPLPEPRTEVVERLIVLQPPGIDVARLRLLDEAGRPVPFEVAGRWIVERFWGIDHRTELHGDRQRERFQATLDHFRSRIDRSDLEKEEHDSTLLIRFLAEDLPPLGHACYHLGEGPAADVATSVETGAEAGCVRIRGDTIENDHYRVRLRPDGTFDLLDRASGRSFPGLNLLEDTEDIGDEYDYSPCECSETITSRGARGELRIVEEGALRASLEASFDLWLPRSIDPGRLRRGRDRVDCRVRARVGLTHESRVIDVELLFDNRARDHRLRAHFPTPIRTDTVVSDGHFLINRRPIDQPRGRDWKQPPAGTYPQQEFTLLEDGAGGIALLNRGLPEIEATHDESGEVRLSLTLLRCVEWLSRDDFETRRRTNAGPTLHTPGAQCPGEHRFRYAVVPFAGSHLEAGIKGISLRYRTPVLAVQGVADGRVRGGEGLLARKTDRTSISAVKKHDTRDTLLVRLYNLGGEAVEEILVLGLDIVSAWRTNLLEERVSQLPVTGRREVTVPLKAHEIATVEMELDR